VNIFLKKEGLHGFYFWGKNREFQINGEFMSKFLSLKDYCDAAKALNCEVAKIRAVATVESAGSGFLLSGKVKILFERHHFARLTNHKFDAEYPQISNPKAGGYYGNEKEYIRFTEAFALNPKAAMMSCSWGKFQIMGFNHGICGFTSVNDFVDAMKVNEGNHLKAFCNFVIQNNLDDELRRGDWAGFARGYNGKNYKINQYDVKMKNFYEKFRKENFNCDEVTPENVGLVIDAQKLEAVQPVVQETTKVEVSESGEVKVETSTAPPEPGKTETVTAPAKEGSTATATQLTIGGIVLPGFVAVIVKMVTDLVEKGFISAAQIGEFVFNMVRENQKYVLWIVTVIIFLLGIKKAFKQLTLLLQIWMAGSKDKNNVEIKPS